MAELPTPDSTARWLLDVCAASPRLRPGDAIPRRTITKDGLLRGRNGAEIEAGLQRCVELGWLERRNGTYFVTHDGFAQM